MSAESDVSTETASSPITEPGQSSLPDDFQINEAEVAPNEVEELQEGSSNDSPLKELDRKLEIPESKSEAVARFVFYLRFFLFSTSVESNPLKSSHSCLG